MQLIFERLSGGEGDEDSLQMIYNEFRDEAKPTVSEGDPGVGDRAFILRMMEGVLERLDEIDDRINAHSHRWSTERMPRVDLTILRVAVWEMLYEKDPEIPVSVVIDEALEMARTFSEPESTRFINGVLGAIWRDQEAAHAE